MDWQAFQHGEHIAKSAPTERRVRVVDTEKQESLPSHTLWEGSLHEWNNLRRLLQSLEGLLVPSMGPSRVLLIVSSDPTDSATNSCEQIPDDTTEFDDLSEIEDEELEPCIKVLYKSETSKACN